VYWENKMSFYISCVWNEYCILFYFTIKQWRIQKGCKIVKIDCKWETNKGYSNLYSMFTWF
jgi:hypothetical protein